MTTNNNIFDNLEELMRKFDWNSVCNNQNTIVENVISKSNLNGSSLAIEISKRSKATDNRYNNKTKASYSSNYEKALITISEKNNGEL